MPAQLLGDGFDLARRNTLHIHLGQGGHQSLFTTLVGCEWYAEKFSKSFSSFNAKADLTMLIGATAMVPPCTTIENVSAKTEDEHDGYGGYHGEKHRWQSPPFLPVMRRAQHTLHEPV